MEDNANRQLSIKLSGDDFSNPDGTPRQVYLKQAYDNSGVGDWELTPFHYSDKETFAALYNGNIIGTVPQNRYEELRSILDKITHLSVTVREYIPDHGRAAEPSAAKHYQAYLSVDYKAEVSASFAPPLPPPAPAAPAPRKLQTSSQESYSSASSPVQTSSRPKSKVLPIVGIVLLLLVIFGNGVSRNSSQGERLKKETVIQHCVDLAEKRLPGAVSYEWDRAKDTFTLFVWDDSFVSTGLAVKAGKDGSAEVWDDLIISLKTVCASMQIKFRDNGYGTTVAVCAVDPSNHDNVLLMVSKNKVLYDATWS